MSDDYRKEELKRIEKIQKEVTKSGVGNNTQNQKGTEKSKV
jgi:hypothetical protein